MQISQKPLRLLLPYQAPFDWPAFLNFFRQRVLPGVERVDDEGFARTIALEQHCGWIKVKPATKPHALQLMVSFPDHACLARIIKRVRRMFDLDANYAAIYEDLAIDPVLKQLMDAHPGLRLPGAWDPFEFAVRAILGQQISVKAATTIAGRIAARHGRVCAENTSTLRFIFPSADVLAIANLDGIGMTERRVQAIRKLASVVTAGDLRLCITTTLDAFIADICALPGFGEWTAHYIAMRALGERDAFPASDLGVMKALNLSKPKEIKALAEAWRPWRAYAVVYLWCRQNQQMTGN
jgi:3-methyladenine DNA glycosylase/8-oxoguanine DNA glycosylase